MFLSSKCTVYRDFNKKNVITSEIIKHCLMQFKDVKHKNYSIFFILPQDSNYTKIRLQFLPLNITS